MDLSTELESIRADLKAAHAEMMSKGSGSGLGEMFVEELGAIWRSIDVLAAAIERCEAGEA